MRYREVSTTVSDSAVACLDVGAVGCDSLPDFCLTELCFSEAGAETIAGGWATDGVAPGACCCGVDCAVVAGGCGMNFLKKNWEPKMTTAITRKTRRKLRSLPD